MKSTTRGEGVGVGVGHQLSITELCQVTRLSAISGDEGMADNEAGNAQTHGGRFKNRTMGE